MKPLIIYHANCTDGWTAAWIAARALGDVELHPGFYGAEPPDVTGREVYILDFSYKWAQMVRLCSQARRVVVLDHHKTAEAELAGLGFGDSSHVSVTFDMERSGARLAWDYFSGAVGVPESVVGGEWLVDYVQDRDLWRWVLPNSREVSAGIEAWKRDDLDEWDRLAALSPAKLAADGAVIEQYRRRCIEGAASLARLVVIAGHEVLAANSSEMRFASDVAHELSEGYPFGATYWIRADGTAQFSLRSRESGIDVAEVAAGLGGGGHRHAAGFQATLSELNRILEDSQPPAAAKEA